MATTQYADRSIWYRSGRLMPRRIRGSADRISRRMREGANKRYECKARTGGLLQLQDRLTTIRFELGKFVIKVGKMEPPGQCEYIEECIFKFSRLRSQLHCPLPPGLDKVFCCCALGTKISQATHSETSRRLTLTTIPVVPGDNPSTHAMTHRDK